MIDFVRSQASIRPVVVIGSGGHARVLIEILQMNKVPILGIVTENPELLRKEVSGVTIRWLESDDWPFPPDAYFVNGIGNKVDRSDNGLIARESVTLRYLKRGGQFASVISPNAIISKTAIMGDSVQILNGAIIQPHARIGEHSIVNTGAIVEHDAQVGKFCHIAPAALLCGNTQIGDYVHVGANATILQQRYVATGTTVPAGTVYARKL